MAVLTRSTRSKTGRSLQQLLGDGDAPLRAVLDSVFVNCFVADLDLTLIWMNRKATVTLQGLGPAIQDAFGLNLGQVLGGSIHRFHQDPARVERILHEPGALPREAVFTSPL